MLRRHMLLVLCASLATGMLFAGNPSMQQQQKLQKQLNQQMSEVLQGTQVEKAVDTVTQDINWYGNLDEAEAQAKKTGKLIFWVHALAKLNGES